jgi:hypothetical protein
VTDALDAAYEAFAHGRPDEAVRYTTALLSGAAADVGST